MRRAPTSPPEQRGFTLVELIVVMSVIGVLAAVVGPRMADTSPFRARASGDAAVAGLRAAQRTAVARRAAVFVTVNAAAGTLALCGDAACSRVIAAPDGAAVWTQADAPLRFDADAAFSIDAFGRPSFATAYLLRVLNADGSDTGRGAQMEPETGVVSARP